MLVRRVTIIVPVSPGIDCFLMISYIINERSKETGRTTLVPPVLELSSAFLLGYHRHVPVL